MLQSILAIIQMGLGREHRYFERRSKGLSVGDRCYSALTCNKKHLKIFEKMGYVGEGPETEHSIEVVSDEANYANYEELNALGGKGIPFHGYHGEGGCYGASRFASDGREVLWITCHHDSNIVVRFNEKEMKVIDEDIDEARHYLEIETKAREYCEADPDELASYGNPIPTAADKKIPLKRRRSDK
jgi:hypothetical protein